MSVLSRVRINHTLLTKGRAWRKKTAIMAIVAVQVVSLSVPVLVAQRAQAASLESATEAPGLQTQGESSEVKMLNAFAAPQAQDKTAPVVEYSYPAAGAIVDSTDLRATITDSSRIDRYSFSVTGPKNWETRTWDVNQKNVQANINLCASDKLKACKESTLPSGTYTVRAAAYDEYGNANTSSATTFVFDTDGPTVNVTSPASGATVKNVLVSGTISDQKLSYFNLELSKVGDWKWDFSTRDYSAANGQTVYTLTNFDLLDAAWFGWCAGWPCAVWQHGGMPALPDGVYTLRVNAYDKLGNRTSYEHNFTLDTKAPVAPTLVSPANNALVSTQTATIANKWNAVADAARYRYQTYGLKDNGACNPANVLSSELYATTQTAERALAEGTFCWGVTAIDAAGNESPSSALWKLTVDNTSPSVQLTSPADGDLLSGTVTISSVVADDNLDYYYLVVVDGDGNPVAYEEDVTGFDWNTTLVDDGEYVIYLETYDKAGNSSSTELLVTVDNTAPVVGMDDLSTLATSPELTGDVDDPDATVFVTVNGQTYQADVDGNTWTLPAGVIAPALAVGTYTVEVTATDLAGNNSSYEATLTVVLPAPVPTPTTPSTPVVTIASVTTPQVLGTATQRLGVNTQNNTQSTETEPQVKAASTTEDSSKQKDQDKKSSDAKDVNDKKGNTWMWIIAVILAVLLILALLYRRFAKALDK